MLGELYSINLTRKKYLTDKPYINNKLRLIVSKPKTCDRKFNLLCE